MTLDELHTHYKYNWTHAAKATGVALTTIHTWRTMGYIPLKWQHRIEFMTNKQLIARFEDVPND